ncbi:MAG: T9SS type A sorting domain-containing protein [Bacteroidales bacterium]|jgi:hypothetical protein
MKIKIKIALIILISLMLLKGVNAEKPNYPLNSSGKQANPTTNTNNSKGIRAIACKPPNGSSTLALNNVKARINTGGDMWWDLQSRPQYEIPKGSGISSMYSSSLWMAGIDANNQLKGAALLYRTSGNDFWTGPLTHDGTAAIDASMCQKFDKHFRITKADVLDFVVNKKTGADMPQSIREWPGNYPSEIGNCTSTEITDKFLAPYYDIDGDFEYHPELGDYPYYDLGIDPVTFKQKNRVDCHQRGDGDNLVFGDETLWWVFNDNGNIHSEMKGQPIGMEIRAQAFAFATNDEINNMTFYNYQLINRSTYTLTSTYFCQWVDPDLGGGWDDFVGCDVTRGLGYCYNGDLEDSPSSGELAYQGIPPAVGVDYFQGPYMDNNNKLDAFTFSTGHTPASGDPAWNGINGVNFQDTIVDNERLGMQRFLYHNNVNSPIGNPDKIAEIYNLMRGIWRDGMRMQYGGNGHDNTCGPNANFMFPGNTDQYHWGTDGKPPVCNADNWTEKVMGNVPSDRRFMESSGPFTLQPGAVNYITVGIPWAKATQGDNWTSVELLKIVDDKCQRLFDNCFKVVDGPDAPDLTIQELDKELILTISNKSSSNNYDELYEEKDPQIRDKYEYATTDTTTIVVTGDTKNQCSNWVLTNFNYKNQAKLYWTLIDSSSSIKVRLYEDSAHTLLTSEGIRTGNGVVTLVNKGKYNISGSVTISYVVNDTDRGNTITKPGVNVNKTITNDTKFHFQGYQIYQVKDQSVSVTQLSDPDYARLVAQCDTKDGVSRLINYEQDLSLNADVPKEKVNGENKGIRHSFRILSDRFATGNDNLVNHKTYYFIAIAYAYNQYAKYSTDPTQQDVLTGAGLGGQKIPYLAGRKTSTGKSITPYSAIPHKPAPEAGGTIQNSEYGYGPKITRIEGQGSGYLNVGQTDQYLDLTDESINEILSKSQPPAICYTPTYKNSHGPITVQVIDPLNVVNASFLLKFNMDIITTPPNAKLDSIHLASWNLINETTGAVYNSEKTIKVSNEQLIPEIGLSVTIQQNPLAIIGSTYFYNLLWGNANIVDNYNNGVIMSSITYADSTKKWLSGVPDIDGIPGSFNWIRSGTATSNCGLDCDYSGDANQVFEKLVQQTVLVNGNFYSGGTWAPYYFTSHYNSGDGWQYAGGPQYRELQSSLSKILMKNLAGVDIVLTPDKSKWSRCPVIEMCDDFSLSEGNANVFDIRKHKSVDKNGNTDPSNTASTDPNSPNFISANGMSWFPGYAINVETGERLNIVFGEDSWQISDNGRDMLFNPTSNILAKLGLNAPVIFGGKHYIYVFGHSKYFTHKFKWQISPSYDYGKWLYTKFSEPSVGTTKHKDTIAMALESAMWVGIPLAMPGQEWLSNEAKIRIRVIKPYQKNYAISGNGESEKWAYTQTGGPVDTTRVYYNYGSGPINNNFPAYRFSTSDIATVKNDLPTAKTACDLIGIVPNPYYGFSGYETSQADNRVKIINLPKKCQISIYTVNGVLVRRFNKDEEKTSIDWDLKNTAGIPIASGLYIIHVNIDGVCERTIKWYGALRPIDLENF